MAASWITSRKKTVTLAGTAFLLIILGFLLTVATDKPKIPAKSANLSGTPARKTAEENRDASDKVPDREKPVRSQANLGRQYRTITQLTGQVADSLENDELARTKLISSKETDEGFSFVFEITANPEIEKFFSDLCKNLAEEGGVDHLALRRQAEASFNSFNFPEGFSQKVSVEIPKDKEKEVIYSMITIPKTDDVENVTTIRAPMLSGRASRAQPGWRYEKLLDLDLK